jgi:hypothetical protein
LLKKFVEKIVFQLIQKYIKVLSKGRGFANRYKFSHGEIEIFPKDKNLTKNKEVLPINKSLTRKRWKFC